MLPNKLCRIPPPPPDVAGAAAEVAEVDSTVGFLTAAVAVAETEVAEDLLAMEEAEAPVPVALAAIELELVVLETGSLDPPATAAADAPVD